MKQPMPPNDPHQMNRIKGNRELGTVKGLPDGGKADVESVLWTSVEEGLIYNITKTSDFARICEKIKENRRFG